MILILRKLTKARFNLTSEKKVEQYKIPKSQLDSFEKTIKEKYWEAYLSYEGVDQNCTSFMTEIQKTINSYTRKVKLKPGIREYLPWLNETI